MKKSIGKKGQQNVLRYTVILSVLVVAIIAAWGIIVFRLHFQRMREDFYRNNTLILSAIASVHENELQILSDIATQMDLSGSEVRFLLDEQPIKASALKRQLYQYRSVNQFFDVLYYYYQKDRYLYNHQTSMEVSALYEKGYLLEYYDVSEVRKLLTTPLHRMVLLPEEEVAGKLVAFYDVLSPSAFYLLPVPPDYDSLLFFVVGARHFDQLLMPGEGDQRNSYIIYDGQVIAWRGTEALSETELVGALADGDEQRVIELSGEKYLLTSQTGASGVVYCTVQREDVLSGAILGGAWWILVVLLACSIPAALLVTRGSKRLLRSVRSLNELLETGEESYALDTIESGIQTLLNESQEMKSVNQSMKRTRFVRSFLRSDFPDLESARQEAAEAGFELSHPYYYVAIIGNRQIEDQNQFHTEVLQEIEETKYVDGYGINLLNNNQTVLLLFGESEELLLALCQRILDRGIQVYGEMVLALSWLHDGGNLLFGSKAYIEADAAFASRFIQDNSRPIRYADIGDNDSWRQVRELPEGLMRRYEQAIRAGQRHDVDQAVQEICGYLQRGGASLTAFRIIYDDILHILLSEWQGQGQNWNQIYNAFTLSNCLTIQDFNDLLAEASHLVLDNRTSVESVQSDLATRAIAYMREHFESPELTIGALADALGISSVTLAVEFKNDTGISPSDYLASLRMEEAKRLLRETELLVREVSIHVGYEDDHVFMRRFKKYTGVTPGQYRKENV